MSAKLKPHCVRTVEEEELLHGLPYVSDAEYEPKKGLACWTSAVKLEPGETAYVVNEANGMYVYSGTIKEVFMMSPDRGRNSEIDLDKIFKKRYSWTDSFAVGNARYYIGVDDFIEEEENQEA